MTINRIRPFINLLLRPNQNVFCKGLHLITNTNNSEDNRKTSKKRNYQ